MRAVIVVPTIREAEIQKFLAQWGPHFRDHHVIVVEDNPERSFALPKGTRHVSWKEMDAELGADAVIIPRRTDAVRNYGFLLAARERPDMILTLDDDCYPSDAQGTPETNFVEAHWRMLNTPGTDLPVLDTMFSAVLPVRPRGYPKAAREMRTVVNHGLWNGVPDLDGETQLKNEGMRVTFPAHSLQVPPGVLFPMCGMNLSFRPEALPLVYYMPSGQGQPYHRFADIWLGWILKKVCDHLGWSVRTGVPFVFHSRASNAARNAELESHGMGMNDKLWSLVDRMEITGSTVRECLDSLYRQLIDGIGGDYWAHCSRSARIYCERMG
jgi:reversibly glycosylated polypeptide/UDP-arabinopyranose mutase